MKLSIQAEQSNTAAGPLAKDKEQHPWFRHASKVVNLVLIVAISAIVLYFQIKNWPMQPDIYYTTDPWDSRRGGLNYFCGCSLPAPLQNAQDPPTTNRSLNVCYELSSLETVKVLMYSNNAAALIQKSNIMSSSSNAPINKTVRRGYSVGQEAHDLSWIDSSGPFPGLESLYLGGYKERDTFPKIGGLLSESFMTFPMAYVRYVFVYVCSNCTSCALEKVNNISNSVVPEQEVWASCFYWNDGNKCSSSEHQYQAKCSLYPTQALPGSFAVKRFFNGFLDLPGAAFRPSPAFYHSEDANITSLQPSVLYMNISQAVNSSIQVFFVEVVKGSAFWVSFLNYFSSLDTECVDLEHVEVCNGTSVCNMFASAGDYDLRCLDMRNQNNCIHLMSLTAAPGPEVVPHATLDNMDMSFNGTKNVADWTAADWLDVTCPPFTCRKVHPSLVNWNTPLKIEDDALNHFLATRKLNDDWAQRSGVCTNTYTNVIRHPPARPGNSGNNTILLMTNCSSDKLNQTNTYCWLSGWYHNLDDSPGDAPTRLDDHLMSAVDRQFVCYRVKDQAFLPWFITTFGVLFGWLGTAQLILTFCFFPKRVAVGTKVSKLNPFKIAVAFCDQNFPIRT